MSRLPRRCSKAPCLDLTLKAEDSELIEALGATPLGPSIPFVSPAATGRWKRSGYDEGRWV